MRLRLARGSLRPWLLDTSRVKDGRHVVFARIVLRRGRAIALRATFRVDNKGPDSGRLIALALARHQIDLGTSLIYRFYAFLGDRRLPTRFRGGAPSDDAVAMDAEAALTARAVTGGEAARLRDFLRRPTDRRSPLYHGGHLVRAAAAGGGCTVPKALNEVGKGDKRLWAWQNRSDTAFAGAYRWVQAMASADLAREEREMGAAAPDSPTDCAVANPTPAIDVYLVDGPAATSPRSGNTTGSRPIAIAVPGQCAAGKCSGFVLVNVRASSLKRDAMDTFLTHELFHILEYAQMSKWPTNWNWLVEAGATWAQGHYEPSNPAAATFSNGWYGTYQYATLGPLGYFCATPCTYQYWPYLHFMSQEGASVPKAWKLAAGLVDSNETSARLDGYFPFAAHLRDFAVRDLNVAYHEQSGAAGARLQSGTGGWPAIAETPTPRRDAGPTIALQNTHKGTRSFSLITPTSLDFETQHFSLPGKSQLRYVNMDFSTLGPHHDVDLLVHVAGQKTLERRRLTGQTFSFCRDNPKDDIDAITAVYTNHSLSGDLPRTIQMHYRGNTSCSQSPTEWKGPETVRDTSAACSCTDTMDLNADYVLDKTRSTSTEWVYTMAPNTTARVSFTQSSGGCSTTGSGTLMVSGELDVEEPHSDHTTYVLSASPAGTFPVHKTCTGGYEETDDQPPGAPLTGSGTQGTDRAKIEGSYDSGPSPDARLVKTWNLSASATGDAP